MARRSRGDVRPGAAFASVLAGRFRRTGALGVVLLLVAVPTAQADSRADSSAFRLGRRDALYGLVSAGAVAWAATRDRNLLGVARSNYSRFALDLAADAKALGEPRIAAPTLLAVDGFARLTGHTAVGAATERIALAMAGAGAITQAVKFATGRERPDKSPDDAAHFRPFSGRDAFPSGHATIAFALAAAVDAETRARWVPFVVYPAATLTAWSRVRDGRHWPSDVVGAAALASWTAWKLDRVAQHRWPRGLWLLVRPDPHGTSVSVRARF